MGQRIRRSLTILTCFAIAAALAAAGPALAQEKPRSGGELVFVGAAEPPSFDGHREETFGMLHPVGPHYSTLMRVDPTDKTGTKFIGDLAESWTASPDKRTYTFKIRHGVKFHDGSLMTSKDIKASYDKIIFPAAGVPSSRQEQYKAVEAVEAPNADTVIFRLKYPEGSFIASVSSPWNLIYQADILAKDPRWYEKNIIGTGPFKFVEYVRGSHWVGKKNPDYWDKGKPYLDGYRVIFIQDAAAQVAAIRGERAMIQFRGFSPAAARSARAGPRQQDHRAGESVELLDPGGDEPEEEALRRQARAPCAHAGPRPLERLEGPLAHRRGEGGGRHPGAGHAMGDAARGADEAGGLRHGHQRGARRGAAPPQGGGRGEPLVHADQPGHAHALRAGRHLAHRPVAADRRQREAGQPGDGRLAAGAEVGRLRGLDQCAVQLHRRARHGPPLVPHHVPGQLQQAQGHGDGRSLHEAIARHRSGGTEEVPARLREATLRRGSALHPHPAMAPHRPAPDARCVATRSPRVTS